MMAKIQAHQKVSSLKDEAQIMRGSHEKDIGGIASMAEEEVRSSLPLVFI